jgi:hypothetical protein
MATISNFTGKISKKSLGNCYFSIVNRVPRLSMKPKGRPAVETLQRSEKFKLCVLFSKAAATIPEIKQIWKIHRPEGHSAFNLLVGANYPSISSSGPTVDSMITPKGYELPVLQIEKWESGISISFSELNKCFSRSVSETDLLVIVLLVCTEPVMQSSLKSKTISLSTKIPEYDFSKTASILPRQTRETQPLPSIAFKLDTQQREILSNYRKCIIYIAPAATNKEGKVGSFSSTYSEIIQ